MSVRDRAVQLLRAHSPPEGRLQQDDDDEKPSKTLRDFVSRHSAPVWIVFRRVAGHQPQRNVVPALRLYDCRSRMMTRAKLARDEATLLLPSFSSSTASRHASGLLCFMSKIEDAAPVDEGTSNDVGVDDSGAYRGTNSRFPAHVCRAWPPIASSLEWLVHHRD